MRFFQLHKFKRRRVKLMEVAGVNGEQRYRYDEQLRSAADIFDGHLAARRLTTYSQDKAFLIPQSILTNSTLESHWHSKQWRHEICAQNRTVRSPQKLIQYNPLWHCSDELTRVCLADVGRCCRWNFTNHPAWLSRPIQIIIENSSKSNSANVNKSATVYTGSTSRTSRSSSDF